MASTLCPSQTLASDCLGKEVMFNAQNAIVAVNVHLGYNQETKEYACGGKLSEQICNAGRFSEDEVQPVRELLIALAKTNSCWDIQPLTKLTSLSGFSKPEKILSGDRPPPPSDNRREFYMLVSGRQNASISLKDVEKYLSPTVVSKEFKREKPRADAINCYPLRNNSFQLYWSSSIRAGPLPENLGARWRVEVVGPVRCQFQHSNCWAHVNVDLVSSARVVEGLDTEYRLYSVPELTFFASPEDRSRQKGRHKCHSFSIFVGLNYIKKCGIGLHRGVDRFNCVTDVPNKLEGERITIKGACSFGDNLDSALRRLVHQPIGATVVVFSPEYDDTTEGWDGRLTEEQFIAVKELGGRYDWLTTYI